ncbi:hypothetical protein IJT17_02480, partial [bacterium]|nr:hypothetical protein [bacterium]
NSCSKITEKNLRTDKELAINMTVETPALKPPAAATKPTLTAPGKVLSGIPQLEAEAVITSILDLNDWFTEEQQKRSALPNESYSIYINNLWISCDSEHHQNYKTKHKAKTPRQKQKPKTASGKQAERMAQMESNLAVTNALRALHGVKRYKLDKSKRRSIPQTPRTISKEQIDRVKQIENHIAATNALRAILGITRKKRDKGKRH